MTGGLARVRIVAIACITAVLLTGSRVPVRGASAGQRRQVFTGGVILVPIDVRVLDASGQPVTDLKQDDFTLYEDHVQQNIRHFATETYAAASAPAVSTVPTAAAGSAPASTASTAAAPATAALLSPRQSLRSDIEPQTRRIFLIMFGRGRLQAPSMAVDAMLQFVQTDLLPQDAVAVFYHDRATDFTTDHAAIAALIGRFKGLYEEVEAQLTSWVTLPGAVYGSAGLPPKTQALIDEIFAGAPGVREVAPASGRDENQIARDTGDAVNQLSATDSSFDDFVVSNRETMQDYGSLYTGIDYLRRIDGEKHLIFVSEQGLGLPRSEDDRAIAAEASDARVVLDTILAGGIGDTAGAPLRAGSPGPAQNAPRPAGRRAGRNPPAPQPGRPSAAPTQIRHFFKNASLSTFADETGGIASGHTAAANAVARINDATKFTYVLGYYPANTALDGRFRNVEVRVNRPGVTVLYRHGYYAEDSVTPFDREQMIVTSRLTLAASFPKEIHDIAVHASAGFAKGSGDGGQVNVFATIDPSKLGFTIADGRHADTVQADVFCLDASGRPIGQKQDVLTLRLDDAALAKAKTDGIAFNPTLTVPVRPTEVKVVVYDYAADLVGTAIVKVR